MRLSSPVLIVTASLALPFLAVAAPPNLLFSSGPPSNFCADPPSFNNCTACHSSFLLDSGAGSVTIGAPERYVPGNTYNIDVSVADPAAMRWGFQLTALDRNGQQAGAMSTNQPGVIQIQAGGGREWVNHDSGGTAQGTPNGHTWTFQWTAPAAGTGVVSFYAVGNAANDAQGSGGDYIYSTGRSSVEDLPGAPPITAVLQPQTVFPSRGNNFDVPVRLTNHEATQQTFYVVSRVRLPNGSVFPSSGWLDGPHQVTLNAGETDSLTLSQFIPPGSPLISVDYQVLVGVPGGGLYDLAEVPITVSP